MKSLTWSRNLAHALPPWLLQYWDHLKQILLSFVIFVSFSLKEKKKTFFILLKVFFDLKCECYCHLQCPVKPEISTIGLAVVNQNIYIYFICSSYIVFVARHVLMPVDCVLWRCFEAWRGHIHGFKAVCETVDVYLDRKSDTSCVCDPKCLCFKSQGKSDVVHTKLCSEEIGAACFGFFFLSPSHILGLKLFILLLQSSLNSIFTFLSSPIIELLLSQWTGLKTGWRCYRYFCSPHTDVSRFWFLDWRHWQRTLHWILATSVGSCWVTEGAGRYLLVELMQ